MLKTNVHWYTQRALTAVKAGRTLVPIISESLVSKHPTKNVKIKMYVTVALRDILNERRFLAHIEVAS
jgi:hypothetical protein